MSHVYPIVHHPVWASQFVIYDRPQDCPQHFVVRQWFLAPGRPQWGPLIALADSLEEARQVIPASAVQLPTFADDDPVIAEVWM